MKLQYTIPKLSVKLCISLQDAENMYLFKMFITQTDKDLPEK